MAYQSMDFPQLFLAAQQLREGRQRSELGNLQLEQGRAELDARRTAIAREARLRQALAAWQQGNKGPLQAEFPVEAQKLVESEVDLEAKRASLGKTTAEAEGLRRKSQIEKMSTTARALRSAADMARTNPQAAPLIGRRLSAMAQDGSIMLPGGRPLTEIVDPDALDAMATEAESGAAGFERPELTGRMRDVAASLGMGKAPERALDKPEFSRAMEKQLAKEGGIRIDLGTGKELKGAAEAKAVTGIMDAFSASERLKDIRSRWDSSMSSFGASTAGAVIRGVSGVPVIGRIPPQSAKEWANNQKYVQGAVEDLFLEYKVEKTGAASSDKELQRIMSATLAAGQDPATFQVNLNRAIRALDARMAIYGELISQGAPRTIEEMREFRDKMQIRVRAAERDAAAERLSELDAKGLTPQQIRQALIQEGYLSKPTKG